VSGSPRSMRARNGSRDPVGGVVGPAGATTDGETQADTGRPEPTGEGDRGLRHVRRARHGRSTPGHLHARRPLASTRREPHFNSPPIDGSDVFVRCQVGPIRFIVRTPSSLASRRIPPPLPPPGTVATVGWLRLVDRRSGRSAPAPAADPLFSRLVRAQVEARR
jgi:hypothetical protein